MCYCYDLVLSFKIGSKIMETEHESCNVCGGTDTKLIDGFYYCIECGTQNTDVRETFLEERTLGDGTFAQSSRRKIVHLKKDGIEMSGEWYKWHAFNFIISGLGDELVSLGAQPSFKMKLLWIWTRYIKKYQNKLELMMNKTTRDNVNQSGLTTFMVEEESIPDGDDLRKENTHSKRKNCDITDGSKRDIKFLSKGVILAMLYLSLNLDESEIQLCHLYRFVQEKQLDISNLNRFIPEDINVKKIPGWVNFLRSKLCTQHQLRALAMSLLRILNLGTPKVPDLKKLADNFLTELCLPNDLKLLIYSLMHFRKCSFLDLDNSAKRCLIRMPDYEGTVMTYVLVAIKICFGLDNNYEIKIANIVDKINGERDLQKSYRIGKYSEPSDRLFSFREWCSYIQFRKIMLSKYNLRMAAKYNLDIDDYVYMEQIEPRPKNNEQLPDKIALEIISRLPQDHCVSFIPKELFLTTLTPMSDYTEIIIEYCQDPEIKLKLAEDFKEYSMKYVCVKLELLDENMENVIKGVSEVNMKTEGDVVLGTIVTKKAKTNMVYVKNCENRHWLKTNRPTIDHMTFYDPENKMNDKESDYGYDSESTLKENEHHSVENKTLIAESIEDEKSFTKGNIHKIIEEENLEVNIFDDSFEDLDFKDEFDRNHVIDGTNNDVNDENQIQMNAVPDEDFDRRSDISDEPVLPLFNPDTFDKEKTMKELILFACKKYKIPVPSEYKVREPRKRKEKLLGCEGAAVKRSRKAQSETSANIKELLSNYYNHMEFDFVSKVQREMTLAIRQAELENINNDVINPNLRISIIENGCDAENRSEVPVIQTDLNSISGSIDDPNQIDNSGKTDADQTFQIDENFENNLFKEEEEMNLDDLIPKGDPEFDETKYDIDQLYIKVKAQQVDILFEIKDDPELDEILVKKIEECKHNSEFADLQLKPEKIVESVIKNEQSDSEDEIPLSVFKEQAILIEEMFRQEDKFEHLIKDVHVPEYKYWIRHYDPDFMTRSTDWHTKFDEELKQNTSTSFYFVIQECSSILNCSNFYLYKNMQVLEEFLISKSKIFESKCQESNDLFMEPDEMNT